MAGRELEALEARLLAVVASQQVQHSAELREADKLAGLANRSVEARMERLEQRLGELAEAVQGLHRGQEEQDERVAYFAAETRERLDMIWSEQPVEKAAEKTALDQRLQALEAANAQQAEALQQRFAALEGRLQAPPKAQARSDHGCFGLGELGREFEGVGGGLAAGDAALLAVQDLESLLRSELKAIRKKCNVMQDQLDERTLISLKEFDQRLQEQDKMVKQVINACQENSSRLEEHEFRLGVARTKLEVHDQKLSRLEAARWQRTNSGEVTPTSPCPSPTGSTAPRLRETMLPN